MMFSILWPFKLLVSLFRFFLNLVVTLVCCLTVASILPGHNWPFSLAVHFRPIYFWVLCLAASVTLLSQLFRQKDTGKQDKPSVMGLLENGISAAVLLVCLGINLLSIAPYWSFPAVAEKTSLQKPHLKLLHLNLQGGHNREAEKVTALIQQENPDLIDFVEFEEPWPVLLSQAGLRHQYPYALKRPNGILLLSKIPLKSTQSLLVLAPGKYNATIQGRTLLAEITLSGQPVTVLIGHLPAPFTPEMDETAQLQLSVWAEQRSKFQKNLLVAGDLNTTPWSRGFNSFLQQANLQNSQHQFGVQASWPVIIPIPFTASYINIPPVLYQLFGISIDHVLVSPTLSVLSRKMDTEAGSDHLPVIIEFGLKDGV